MVDFKIGLSLFLYICGLLTLCLLFALLFNSSLSYESRRVEFNAIIAAKQNELPKREAYYSLNSYLIKNPTESELMIRAYLSNPKRFFLKPGFEPVYVYENLLKIRPSWPYYFSGIAQIKKNEKNDFIPSLKKAIMLAPFERKVALSVSQLLFSNWDSVNSADKRYVLRYLAKQNDVMLNAIVESALRFARMFEFCDFLYEQNQKENSVCLREYWRPLNADV